MSENKTTPKLKVIAIEGIENIGKTTLIDYIMKNTQCNVKTVKFPSKDISKVMTDKLIEYNGFITHLNELIRTVNKYRTIINNKTTDSVIDYDNLKVLYSTTEYFLEKIISYNNTLVKLNLKDQIETFQKLRSDNTEDTIILCDRAVLSTYFMNYCEAIYHTYILNTFFEPVDDRYTDIINDNEYYKYAENDMILHFLTFVSLTLDYSYYENIDFMISIILDSKKHNTSNSSFERKRSYYQRFYDENDDIKNRSINILEYIPEYFTTNHKIDKINIYHDEQSKHRKSLEFLYKEIQEMIKKYNFNI